MARDRQVAREIAERDRPLCLKPGALFSGERGRLAAVGIVFLPVLCQEVRVVRQQDLLRFIKLGQQIAAIFIHREVERIAIEPHVRRREEEFLFEQGRFVDAGNNVHFTISQRFDCFAARKVAIGVLPPGIGRKALVVFVGVPRFALVVAKAVLEGLVAVVIADAHLFAVVLGGRLNRIGESFTCENP